MANNTIPEQFTYLDDYYVENIKAVKHNVEEIQQSLRYGTKHNFTGNVVNGYSASSRAVLTRTASAALYRAQEFALNNGYSLLIYDAYRPQKAVDCFVEWAEKPEDCLDCKLCYYPTLKHKRDAFELPDRYVAKQSGHSRGSTVDLTLIKRGTKVKEIERIERKLKNGEKVMHLNDGSLDMWTSFDLFDKSSWHDCSDLVDDKYLTSRRLLRDIMMRSGFIPLVREWWHYSLTDEPFPQTYFDFKF